MGILNEMYLFDIFLFLGFCILIFLDIVLNLLNILINMLFIYINFVVLL